MLNRRIVALGRALIPRFVIDQINPFDRFVLDAVREFAGKLAPNSLILDAGAGEAQYGPELTRALPKGRNTRLVNGVMFRGRVDH